MPSHARKAILMLAAAAFIFAGCRPTAEPSANGEEPTAATAAKKPGASGWPLPRGDRLATGVASTTLPDQPELLWEFSVAKGSFETTPVVAKGVVYIGDMDGTFYALDLKTGKEKWRYRIGQEKPPTEKKRTSYLGSFTGSPSVHNGRVYVGDIDGRVRCFDAATGKPLWGFETGAEINGSPNFYKGAVLIGSQDATLYALEEETGKLRWKFEIDDQIRCAPTLVENRAFLAGCDGKLHIINLDEGKADDDVAIDSPTGATPAVLGSNIYFGTEAGEFFCIDWKQAKTVWVDGRGDRRDSIRSSAAVTKEVVIYGARDGKLRGLDPVKGHELWVFRSKRQIDSSPVIVGKRAFFGAHDGRIYAVNIANGKEAWEFETGGEYAAGPAVADGRLIIANTDGFVYCFGAE